MPPAKIVYGGVAISAIGGAAVLVDGLSTDFTEIPPGLYLLGIDAPLSAVADTLTLPITVPATIGRMRHTDTEKPEEQKNVRNLEHGEPPSPNE